MTAKIIEIQSAHDALVLIDHQKVYQRAFDDNALRLYIPVDGSGNVTAINPVELLCWAVDSSIGFDKGSLADSDLAISDLLLWHPDDVENGVRYMAKLSRCVAFKTIGKMNDWLSQLTRQPHHDIDLKGNIWTRS